MWYKKSKNIFPGTDILQAHTVHTLQYRFNSGNAIDQRVQPGTCGGNRASARVQVRGAVSDAQLHEAPPSRPRRCVPGARAWDTCSSLIFTLLLLLQGSMRFRRGSVACAPSGTHGIHFCANSSRKPARYRMVPCSSLWPRAWTRLFA